MCLDVLTKQNRTGQDTREREREEREPLLSACQTTKTAVVYYYATKEASKILNATDSMFVCMSLFQLCGYDTRTAKKKKGNSFVYVRGGRPTC